MWQLGVFNSRSAAYKWLAASMKLPPQRTHIAMFDIRQCQRAIGIIQQQFWKIQGNTPSIRKVNNMKLSEIAISIDNGFDVVAVWEKDSKRWHLLQLARPLGAIALYQENPKARLVFPTEINPNHLGQLLTKHSRQTKSSKYAARTKR